SLRGSRRSAIPNCGQRWPGWDGWFWPRHPARPAIRKTGGPDDCAVPVKRLTSISGTGKVLMREILFLPLIVLVLFGADSAVAQLTRPSVVSTAAPTVNDQDRVLGKQDAPVTIIEYASYTCPHCAHFAINVLPKLKEKWIDPGKAKLVMRA